MGFSGLYNRLFAYYPFPVEHLEVVQGIEDLPVPGRKLYGILALVLNGYCVAKGKMHFIVLEERAFKTGSHRYLDSFGNLCDHKLILKGKDTSQDK